MTHKIKAIWIDNKYRPTLLCLNDLKAKPIRGTVILLDGDIRFLTRLRENMVDDESRVLTIHDLMFVLKHGGLAINPLAVLLVSFILSALWVGIFWLVGWVF